MCFKSKPVFSAPPSTFSIFFFFSSSATTTEWNRKTTELRSHFSCFRTSSALPGPTPSSPTPCRQHPSIHPNEERNEETAHLKRVSSRSKKNYFCALWFKNKQKHNCFNLYVNKKHSYPHEKKNLKTARCDSKLYLRGQVTRVMFKFEVESFQRVAASTRWTTMGARRLWPAAFHPLRPRATRQQQWQLQQRPTSTNSSNIFTRQQLRPQPWITIPADIITNLWQQRQRWQLRQRAPSILRDTRGCR